MMDDKEDMTVQIGIRLHDVNANGTEEQRTLEARAATARQEGFACVHLALTKCVSDATMDNAALTEGLAAHIRRVFRLNDLDVAVLGCYLNLAHPDTEKVRQFPNENLGMNTLVHGHIGNSEAVSNKISAKLRGWCDYKAGDAITVSFARKRFFDVKTGEAIGRGREYEREVR